jgi:hypothetical protein
VYVYEDSLWKVKEIPDAGITVACTGLTATTAYYLYVYDNAGTLTLDLSTTVPVTQSGINVKTGATDRLLIARCYTDGSGDVVTYNENAAKQLLCNIYNKRKIGLRKIDTTNTWTYSTTTWRAANNDTANRVEFVTDGKDAVVANVHGLGYNSTSSSVQVAVGVALDATNTNHAATFGAYETSDGGAFDTRYNGLPSAGYHYLQWTEIGGGGGPQTWIGDNGTTRQQSGLEAEVMA